MEPVRFGVIGTAKIALEKVIPAMQASRNCRIAAIASRDRARAEAAAPGQRGPAPDGEPDRRSRRRPGGPGDRGTHPTDTGGVTVVDITPRTQADTERET